MEPDLQVIMNKVLKVEEIYELVCGGARTGAGPISSGSPSKKATINLIYP